MKIRVLSFFTLALLTTTAFAYDYQNPQEVRHENHENREEMNTIYSSGNHQGMQNLDERFWVLYNNANDTLNNASNKVSSTNTFTYQHNMANLNANEQGQYQTLLNQERPVMAKWLSQRDELLNLIYNARQAGSDVSSYEQRMDTLMQSAQRIEKQIADRPY